MYINTTNILYLQHLNKISHFHGKWRKYLDNTIVFYANREWGEEGEEKFVWREGRGREGRGGEGRESKLPLLVKWLTASGINH